VTARTSTARAKSAKPAPTAPVQLKSRPKTPPRELLFSIDDVDYTMPAVVELGDSIALAATMRILPDEDAKGIHLVRELCGRDAITALLADATMTRGEWQTIVRILTEKAFGPLEQEAQAEGN
jgi:hypothetical protein